MGVCGVVLVWSLLERRSRGLQRRRAGLAIFAAGNAILYFGQVLGYVYIARDAGTFQGWVEAGPLLVAGPILAIGMFLLCWPPGLNRADLWAIGRDSALALVGLVTIWVALVEPVQHSSVSHNDHLVEQLDPWVQLLGFLSLVVVASASRRSGMLPVYQLMLLQGGVLVYLLSDIVGQSVPAADLESWVTYSIVGYCLSRVPGDEIRDPTCDRN